MIDNSLIFRLFAGDECGVTISAAYRKDWERGYAPTTLYKHIIPFVSIGMVSAREEQRFSDLKRKAWERGYATSLLHCLAAETRFMFWNVLGSVI